MQKSLRSEQKRHDRLLSQLHLTRQQIELYTKESESALEGLKDCNWRITKELCSELRKIPFPSKTLAEICEKLMTILSQQDTSYQGFKALTKNFSYFKTLMSSVQNQALSDTLINEILPIWKNQTIFQAKLYKLSKCGCLLAKWINLLVEFNLKRETIENSKRREPELQKKVRNSGIIIGEIEKQICAIKETLSQKCSEECEGINEIALEEFTEKFKFIAEAEKENFGQQGLKGVLGINNSEVKVSIEFPNFGDDNLYDENHEQIGHQINYEAEEPGCCNLKFFCI